MIPINHEIIFSKVFFTLWIRSHSQTSSGTCGFGYGTKTTFFTVNDTVINSTIIITFPFYQGSQSHGIHPETRVHGISQPAHISP